MEQTKIFSSSEAHENYIYSELLNLDRVKKIAFITSIAERLLPIYNVFFTETGWGDPKIPRETLDKI
jgi:uncharacterized protein YjaG (DUF416 family)